MIVFYRLQSESPNMRKISLMLEEIGQPFTVKYIESHHNEEVDPEFARISPNGTLPAIVDSETGVALFESVAILFYLADKNGLLLPSEIADRAEVVKWLTFEAANICPTILELHHYTMNDSGDLPETIFERYKNRLSHYCSILDTQLQDREFLAGEYSIADIAIYPWTVTLEDMAEVNLGDFHNLDRWAAAVSQRPAAQQPAESDLLQTN